MSGPLEGRRILVTRLWPDLTRQLSDLGATVVEVPLIAIAPPVDPGPFDAALRDVAAYDWLVFTSANAVAAVAQRLAALGLDLPAGRRVASVGPATTQAIEAAWPGTRVEVQPEAEFRASSLAMAFGRTSLRGQRVLLPVSDRAFDTVARGLTARGAEVDQVVAYSTVISPSNDALERELTRGVDAAALASPSAVDAFSAAGGEAGRRVPLVVIGPTTADAARTAGFTVLAVAEPSTTEGLAQAVTRALGGGRAPAVAHP